MRRPQHRSSGKTGNSSRAGSLDQIKILHRRIAALFFIALGALHFALYKFADLPYFLSNDQCQYAYQFLALLKSGWEKGRVPFWSPEIFLGQPLLFIGSYDFKLNLFLSWLPVLDCMVLHAVWCIAWGGYGYYLFAETLLGFSLGPALIGGLFWVLQGFFCWYFYDTGIVLAYIWIPWLIWLAATLHTRPFRKYLLLVFAVTDILLSGRPEGVEVAFWTSVIFLFTVHFDRVAVWQSLVRAASKIKYLLFAGLTALLVVSPFLTEQFHIITRSARAGFGVDSTLLQFDPFNQPLSIFNFLNTLPNGHHILPMGSGLTADGFVGLIGLLLLVIGLSQKEGRKRVGIYALLAGAMLFFVYDFEIAGVNPFNDLYKSLPAHQGIRYPQRLLPWFFFFSSIVVMEGARSLVESEKIRERRRPLVIEMFLVLSALGFAAAIVFTQPSVAFEFSHPTLALGLLVLNIMSLVALYVYRRKAFAVYGILATTIFVGSYFVNYSVYSRPPFANLEEIKKHIPERYFTLFKQEAPYEFRVHDSSTSNLDDPWPSILAINGTHITGGYYTLVNRDVFRFFAQILRGPFYNTFVPANWYERPEYALLNVKYFIMPAPRVQLGQFQIASAKPYLKLIDGGEAAPIAMFENTRFMSRAMFFSRFHPAQNTELAFAQMATWQAIDSEWFYKRIVVTDPEMSLHVSDEAKLDSLDNSFQPAKIEHYDNDRVEISVEAPREGFVTLQDAAYPIHWQAKIDGEPAPIYFANAIFRAVHVVQGKHKIEFTYRLPWQAWALSALGIITALLSATFLSRGARTTVNSGRKK